MQSRLKSDSCDFETFENWEQENEVTIIKLSDSQSSNCIINVLQKIHFNAEHWVLCAFPTQEKAQISFQFLPLFPPQDGIFVIIIFCIQSLHMQESFAIKERHTFKVVLWKMFHIIRSLTHHTDVSACLYKDLEQSVLATELTSKLFDPKFLYFDNAIMHLTQGHHYPLTYRKPS